MKMLLVIFTLLLATSQPQADSSSLTFQCESQDVNSDSLMAMFETLDYALLAENQYYNGSGKYLTTHNEQLGLSIDTFEQRLNTTIPLSSFPEGNFRLMIGVRMISEDTDTCRALIISFFNASNEYNMPIITLQYYKASGIRKYDYTESGKHITITKTRRQVCAKNVSSLALQLTTTTSVLSADTRVGQIQKTMDIVPGAGMT